MEKLTAIRWYQTSCEWLSWYLTGQSRVPDGAFRCPRLPIALWPIYWLRCDGPSHLISEYIIAAPNGIGLIFGGGKVDFGLAKMFCFICHCWEASFSVWRQLAGGKDDQDVFGENLHNNFRV